MNRKKSLNCIVIVMFLFVSVVFFTTSPANVSAQESKSGLTLGIGPGQSLGVGLDIGQVIFMVGGSFDLYKWGDDVTLRISPQASIKLFAQRTKLSPYWHGRVAKRFVFAEEDSEFAPIILAGALGLEYAFADNLSIGGEAGLELSADGDPTRTILDSYHAFTLNYYF